MIYVELRFKDGHRESFVTKTDLRRTCLVIRNALRGVVHSESAANRIYERLPHCRGSIFDAKHQVVAHLPTRHATSGALD